MSETQTRDATETAPPPEQQAPAEQVEQPAAEHTEHAAPPAPDADDANDTDDTDEQDEARGFPAGQVTLGALSVLTIAGVLAFQAIGLIGLVAAGAVATGGAAMLVRRRLGHAAQARRTRTRTTRTAWSAGRSGGSRGLLSGGLLGGRSRGRSGRRGGGLLGGRSGGKRGGLLGGRSGGKRGGLLGGRSGGKGRGASRLGMTGAGGRGRRGGGSGKRVGRSRVRPGKSGRTLGPPPIGTTVRPPKGRGARGGASRGAKGGARGGARGGGSAGTRSAHRSTGRVGARARRAGRTAARRVDAMTGGRASKAVRKVAGKHSPARRAARRTGRVINRATGGRAGRWWRRNRRRTKRGATLAGLTAGFFAVFMAPAWLLVAAGGALMATAVGLFASERRAKKRKTGPKSKTGTAGHGTQNASASTAGEPPLTGIPVGPPVRDPRRARTNPRNPWRNALEAGFPLAVAAAEMNPVAAAYAPENMWVVGVDLRQLPEVFTQVAMALRTYAQRLEGDYPIHPQVVEAIGQLYIGLGGLAESAQEIEALFRALHADDLKREEAPRVNEPAWNV